ncbi:L-aspartate oxidase [Kiloniella laminariae]|uniref:L-aspartate oxidase n=1 Tax=Kiloniella laminariae TaxID=454162 RepID=A0ABT4LIJ3_9PROT|nr:L-aspartate oxidase [Kiloniella laminariae]MCZ4280927.1 L-aspartate oxidase [Kiloniella laminariae]
MAPKVKSPANRKTGQQADKMASDQSLACDVLIIGAGIAGLMTALSLAPRSVILLSKGPLGQEASSTWAQGGISAALSPDDSPENHQQDTLAVAGGIANSEIAKLVTDLGPERIRQLVELGVVFDRDGQNLSLSREAAHSHRRVVHANGDSTGREVMRALRDRTQESPHIIVLEQAEALDLIIEDQRVAGTSLIHQGKIKTVTSAATVLATGGIGQLFSATTNPFAASGDGLAMAARAGALLQDLEFVQFHPTAIDVAATPLPLATEALRGDGALLVNDLGEHFMLEKHPLAELAPRDVVARGIWDQIEQGRRCYLDCRIKIGQRFPQLFPTVFTHCQNHGIDPRCDLIPVLPAAHYHMGGIATDARGRSSLPGLWVCGEAACTGLHGANRLASNSLLEALVFGPLVSDDIKNSLLHSGLQTQDGLLRKPAVTHTMPPDFTLEPEADVIKELQLLNYRHIGLCRNRTGLQLLIEHLRKIGQEHDNASPRLRNLMTCSHLIATAALNREESRGGHFRSDYPQSLSRYQNHSLQTLNDCSIATGTPSQSFCSPTDLSLAS